jgi:tetratricopeptide (TPR) repeat protein
MSHELIEQLQQDAAAHYLQGEFELALESWRELLKLSPDDERALEGVRLCEMVTSQETPPEATAKATAEAPPTQDPLGFSAEDLAGLDSLFGGGGDTPAEEMEFDAEAFNCDIAAKSPPPLPAEVIEEASAEPREALRNRVNEMLSESLVAYESGDLDEALNVLERVFILDEENVPAQALKNKLLIEQQRPEGAPEEAVTAEPALDLEDTGGVPLDLSGAEPVTEAEEQVVEEPPAPPTRPASPDANRIAGLLANKPAVIGVATAVVLIVAGFSAWNMLSGSDAEPVQPPITQAETPTPQPPVETTPEPLNTETVEVVEVVEDVDKPLLSIEALMAQARTDFEAGNFGLAVVAYDEILEREPTNGEAEAGIAIAVERYDQQKRFSDSLSKALTQFDQALYRESLYELYRLPEGGDPGTIQRYQLNAWFNLGLQALRSGDCDESKSSFDEATVLDPADPALKKLKRLTRACQDLQRDATYYADLKQFELRAKDG